MIQSFFANAAFPKRVFLAIIQQNAPNDQDCVASYCDKLGKTLQAQGDGGFRDVHGCDFYDQV